MKIFHRDKIEIFGPGPLLALSDSWGQPRRADWHPKHFHTVYLGGTHPYHALGPLNGPLRHSRAPKGPVLAPKGPFGGPIGTRRAQRVQIWSQLPPIGLTGFKSWLPHTLAWYLASSWPPVAPKGPISALNVPYWPPQNRTKIVANLSCEICPRRALSQWN